MMTCFLGSRLRVFINCFDFLKNPDETDIAQSVRDIFVGKSIDESLHGLIFVPTTQNREVVMLLCDRQKPKAISARHGLDRYAPIGAALRYCRGNRVM